MSQLAADELWSIFDARRVKQPELTGFDMAVAGLVGVYKNRLPYLSYLRKQAERIELMEKEVHTLGSNRFKEEVDKIKEIAHLGRFNPGKYQDTPSLERGMALVREAAWRSVGKRPFKVQVMGAMAMAEGYIVEMATGEGKTLTASLTASLWALAGKPVNVITVNDYLVQRDAELMGPVYDMMGLRTGFVVHDTNPMQRIDHYRRDVVYVTSKELVADFLRDQLILGTLRTSAQTAITLLANQAIRQPLMVPGLFKVIVDEADSLLIDEAVTPLIISNSPSEEANAKHYRAAHHLAENLEEGAHFKIDWTVRNCEMLPGGEDKLDELVGNDEGIWKGRRRREELVTQALTARHCYVRGEQYLVGDDGKVQIIDEFTGRIMADRSWRHGLHQAIEVKEEVTVTADKENLARLSFQRFFRQFPIMCGMTGTAWESAGEMWQIYRRPVVRIPTNKPCVREQLPVRFFETTDQKYDAVVERVVDLHKKGVPILIGTRSVLASLEVGKRLQARQTAHRVLNATQTAQEASIIAEAGQHGKITVATNMAGRGTDIILGRGVAELGGLHVISTEPHGSGRVDRQLFGRSARQGDPGSAQLFACKDDDVFVRHAKKLRFLWRAVGAQRLIRMAQNRAERLARFNRKQVLKNDDWMDQAVPF